MTMAANCVCGCVAVWLCGCVAVCVSVCLWAVYWQPSVEDLKTAAVDDKGLLHVYARVDMRTKGTCVPNGVGCGYTVTMCAPPKNFITAAYCEGIVASGTFDQVCNS